MSPCSQKMSRKLVYACPKCFQVIIGPKKQEIKASLSVPSLCIFCLALHSSTQFEISLLDLQKMKCDICSKNFSTLTNLNRHLKTHFPDNSFVCAFCAKTFTTRQHHDEHLTSHMTNLDKVYSCNKCETTYRHKASLRRHMKTHQNPVPNADSDSDTATRQTNFDKHLTTHLTHLQCARKPTFTVPLWITSDVALSPWSMPSTSVNEQSSRSSEYSSESDNSFESVDSGINGALALILVTESSNVSGLISPLSSIYSDSDASDSDEQSTTSANVKMLVNRALASLVVTENIHVPRLISPLSTIYSGEQESNTSISDDSDSDFSTDSDSDFSTSSLESISDQPRFRFEILPPLLSPVPPAEPIDHL